MTAKKIPTKKKAPAKKKSTRKHSKKTTQRADPFAESMGNVKSVTNFAIGATVGMGALGIVSGAMGAIPKK
jgi:hypothetical protein